MLYIVHKNSSTKELFKECFARISEAVHDKSEALETFNKRVCYLKLSSINNKDFVNRMDTDEDFLYIFKGHYYLKTYDKAVITKPSYALETLVSLYTHIMALGEQGFEELANSGDDYSYSSFYGTMDADIVKKVEGKPINQDLSHELLELAKLSFSNGSDKDEDNDLLKGFLYDREYLYNKFEKRMGNGAFEDFNNCINLSKSDDVVVNPNKFNKLINYLRKYYYISIRENNNLSLEENNIKIIDFDNACFELRNKYLPKNKKTL